MSGTIKELVAENMRLRKGIKRARTRLLRLWNKVDDYPFYNRHGTWVTAVDILDTISNIAATLNKDTLPTPPEKENGE